MSKKDDVLCEDCLIAERDEARELAYDLAGRSHIETLRWFFRTYPWAGEIADRKERERDEAREEERLAAAAEITLDRAAEPE